MKKIILVFSIVFFYFGSVFSDIKIKPLYEGNVDAKINIITLRMLIFQKTSGLLLVMSAYYQTLNPIVLYG